MLNWTTFNNIFILRYSNSNLLKDLNRLFQEAAGTKHTKKSVFVIPVVI